MTLILPNAFTHTPYGADPDQVREPNYRGVAPLAMDVLDHGFVALRNLSGPTRRIFDDPQMVDRTPRMFDADDIDPAQSARMSFDQMDSSRTRAADLRLCDYLMRNCHSTPFEMVECWLEMKMPIFVARQFVRHRTVTINEVSGRYITLPGEWHIPRVVGGVPANAKQGQADTLDGPTQEWFKATLDLDCRASYAHYLEAINRGVAHEHARTLLHLNHYTHWLWKQDLHNILHFLRLRDHSHAQVEAQAYGRTIDAMLRLYLPESMALYDKYRRTELTSA